MTDSTTLDHIVSANDPEGTYLNIQSMLGVLEQCQIAEVEGCSQPGGNRPHVCGQLLILQICRDAVEELGKMQMGNVAKIGGER